MTIHLIKYYRKLIYLVQIWHGQTDIAITRSNATSEWSNVWTNYRIDNMYDDDELTIWHTSPDFKTQDKVLTIDFLVSYFTHISFNFFSRSQLISLNCKF